MKKIYLTPETIETKIELQKMIAGSAPQLIDPNEEADPDGEVLTRRRNRNAWEDEEYDDEEDF